MGEYTLLAVRIVYALLFFIPVVYYWTDGNDYQYGMKADWKKLKGYITVERASVAGGSFVILAVIVGLLGCSGSGQFKREFDNRTYRYDISVDKYENKKTRQCSKVRVSVKPLNKLYIGDKPLDHLILIDTDCRSPIEFESVRWRDARRGINNGGRREISRLKSNRPELFHHVHKTLFQKGVYR